MLELNGFYNMDCMKGMAEIPDKYFEKKVMELKGTATALKIGEIVGISNTTVGKMLKDDYKPYETGARYFSDLVREREWFDNL